MTTIEPFDQAAAKEVLHRYLRSARDALLWKLDGLSEYDIRRPMTPTGTNLLGLVKHVAGVAIGYFGETFGRPFAESVPWYDEGADPTADMWAAEDESHDYIVGFHHRAWAHADATIEQLPLGAIGRVPWWPDDRAQVTLQHILVHMATEVNRHAGHADILRETIDGAIGHRQDVSNLPDNDSAQWAEYFERLERIAQSLA